MFVNQRHRRDLTMRRLMTSASAVFILLALATGLAFAGSDERKGTSGADELQIPIGARGTALGTSVVSDVVGIESIFWNPAGLAAIEGTEAMFSHQQYFADQKLNYAAVAAKVGGWGVIGFNAKVLSVGDVFVTTEDAPEGTGEIFNPTFTVLGMTYARQFTDRVMFGLTLNLDNERIQNTSASGVAFDFGVQYLTGWNGLKLGMCMKNFGTSMEFTGPDFETNLRPPDTDPSSQNRTFRSTSAKFEMPSFFTLAASYDLVQNAQNHLALMGSFRNNNFTGDNFSGGAEWSYKNMFALRGSYFGSLTTTEDFATGDETGKFTGGDDLYTGLALGLGTNVKTGNSSLGVDVSWRPLKSELTAFTDIVEVGLRIKF